MKTEKGMIKTERFSMEYFRFGKGDRPLVILPGISVRSVLVDANVIADQYKDMAEIFIIFVMDRRLDMPEKYNVRDMARDTAEAMQSLGLKDVYLFGASQGGMIAMTIAAEHPELVRRLAVGSSSACVTQEQYRGLEEWADLARKKDAEALYMSFGEKIYPPAVFEEYRPVFQIAAKMAADRDLERFVILAEGTEGFDIREDLKHIKCPVLITGSLDDAVLGPESSPRIADALNGVTDTELYMYDGYGHDSFDTAPDYRDRLTEFFLRD
jgi:pimeloyl-ACP methyl ester carboxylesterase